MRVTFLTLQLQGVQRGTRAWWSPYLEQCWRNTPLVVVLEISWVWCLFVFLAIFRVSDTRLKGFKLKPSEAKHWETKTVLMWELRFYRSGALQTASITLSVCNPKWILIVCLFVSLCFPKETAMSLVLLHPRFSSRNLEHKPSVVETKLLFLLGKNRDFPAYTLGWPFSVKPL